MSHPLYDQDPRLADIKEESPNSQLIGRVGHPDYMLARSNQTLQDAPPRRQFRSHRLIVLEQITELKHRFIGTVM